MDPVHIFPINGDKEDVYKRQVVDSLQQLGYLAFQLVQRNKGLFTVVAADNDALVLFDVLWTCLLYTSRCV